MAVNACKRSDGTPPGPPRLARAGEEPGYGTADRWDEPWVASSRSPCRGGDWRCTARSSLRCSQQPWQGCCSRKPAQPEPPQHCRKPAGAERRCPTHPGTAPPTRQRHGLRRNALLPEHAPAEASPRCDADQPIGHNGTTRLEPPARADPAGAQPDRQVHQRHELRHGTPHAPAAD